MTLVLDLLASFAFVVLAAFVLVVIFARVFLAKEARHDQR